jgi:hypothetical protein
MKPAIHRAMGLLVVLFAVIGPQYVEGQTYVDTLPANKNVLLEEFTAVHCSWCPAAHRLMDSLITEHPGRIVGLAMHPANTSYTAPYAGSQDLRRSYVDAFFSIPFATDSMKFFPGAFINRREWLPNRRERYTTTWRHESDSLLQEPSPLNIGLHASYDGMMDHLMVNVEVYATDTVDFPVFLYVYLSEDSLVAEQNNGGVDYVHMHIFRESFTPQWGDSILPGALPGDLSMHYYTNAVALTGYAIEQCHVIAALRNGDDEEIITCDAVAVDLITAVNDEAAAASQMHVYPLPFDDHFFIASAAGGAAFTYCLYDLQGRKLFSGSALNEGPVRVDMPRSIASGAFILEVRHGEIYERRIVLRR